MKLTRINYNDLNAKQKEVYNFQKIASILADYGFNSIKLADDWQGADFLAYHKDGERTLKVQLKGRLTVAKKYRGKDLYMAFPIDGDWYLIPHDDLLEIVFAKTKWAQTESWTAGGVYSASRPSKEVVEALSAFKLS